MLFRRERTPKTLTIEIQEQINTLLELEKVIRIKAVNACTENGS